MKMVHLSIYVFYIFFRHCEQTSKLQLPFLNMCMVFFNITFRPREETSKLVLLVKYEDNGTDVFFMKLYIRCQHYTRVGPYARCFVPYIDAPHTVKNVKLLLNLNRIPSHPWKHSTLY